MGETNQQLRNVLAEHYSFMLVTHTVVMGNNDAQGSKKDRF